ncbi:hypothetical protein GWK47_029012 [Chionoecetes opilio]|uniref:Uncharacterized protein n=1 Tax=Chionoecetes opilio TaxID=41210 RepID=A0A8J5D396_CHIOP|nr:hypothetical protein GWK47_029012 [Chionoecetes opilio]
MGKHVSHVPGEGFPFHRDRSWAPSCGKHLRQTSSKASHVESAYADDLHRLSHSYTREETAKRDRCHQPSNLVTSRPGEDGGKSSLLPRRPRPWLYHVRKDPRLLEGKLKFGGRYPAIKDSINIHGGGGLLQASALTPMETVARPSS